jgi:hypothetical protein
MLSTYLPHMSRAYEEGKHMIRKAWMDIVTQ